MIWFLVYGMVYITTKQKVQNDLVPCLWNGLYYYKIEGKIIWFIVYGMVYITTKQKLGVLQE